MPTIQPQLPEALPTGGEAFGIRGVLEEEYQERLDAEILWFMREVEREQRALPEGRTLSTGDVLLIWGTLLDRVERWLPETSALAAELDETDLPTETASTVQMAVATAVLLGLSAAQTNAQLKTMLGLAKNPVKGMGGEYGRLLTNVADGKALSSRSWTKQSETWARTSATADFGDAMLQQLRREGYTHKRWMTRYDSRVRDSHAAVDRETILLEESFIVGGSAMMYPADPMGPIEEIANCRCVLVGVNY